MKELLGEILFGLGLVIAPYAIIIGIAVYSSCNPTYPYSDHTMYPYRDETKQIEYMDVIERQYEESHTYCHYCHKYMNKKDLYEVFIFYACKDCYKEASKISYEQFYE